MTARRIDPVPYLVGVVFVALIVAVVLVLRSDKVRRIDAARPCAIATQSAAGDARAYVERTLNVQGAQAAATVHAEAHVTTPVGRPVTVDLTCTEHGWQVTEAQRAQ